MTGFPYVRLRRLRRTAAMRDMLGIDFPKAQKFVWPVFLIEGTGKEIPIDAMPGQHRYSVDRLIRILDPIVESGVRGILLFAVLDRHKDSHGSYAFRDDGLIQDAISKIRTNYPDLLIFTDVCLCSYTDHGHCGALTKTGDDVDNDATLELLKKIAVSHARAGTDGVAPSAMMDGQVAAIRQSLTEEGFNDTIIMSYSTKFVSSLYGPFREAAQSTPSFAGRHTYQAPYCDPKQAIRESRFDISEAADIIMVKPALFYLDIIYRIRNETDLPIAAYNVSGEYAMISACARSGWGDLKEMVRESMIALSRAGTDIIISYWANQYKGLA